MSQEGGIKEMFIDFQNLRLHWTGEDFYIDVSSYAIGEFIG